LTEQGGMRRGCGLGRRAGGGLKIEVRCEKVAGQPVSWVCLGSHKGRCPQAARFRQVGSMGKACTAGGRVPAPPLLPHSVLSPLCTCTLHALLTCSRVGTGAPPASPSSTVAASTSCGGGNGGPSSGLRCSSSSDNHSLSSDGEPLTVILHAKLAPKEAWEKQEAELRGAVLALSAGRVELCLGDGAAACTHLP